MWYALIHMYLQKKADAFSQACTCMSYVNQHIKYSNLAYSLNNDQSAWL